MMRAKLTAASTTNRKRRKQNSKKIYLKVVNGKKKRTVQRNVCPMNRVILFHLRKQQKHKSKSKEKADSRKIEIGHFIYWNSRSPADSKVLLYGNPDGNLMKNIKLIKKKKKTELCHV